MNKINYYEYGDYLMPNLIVPYDKYEDYHICKYGMLRLEYLKEHKNADYTIMLMEGNLICHIVEVDKEARTRVDAVINNLVVQNNLAEELKNTTPLYWVGMMNIFKNQAEEISFNELIYV